MLIDALSIPTDGGVYKSNGGIDHPEQSPSSPRTSDRMGALLSTTVSEL